MFEVRCIVADKNLGNVLKALNGLTIEPPITLVVDEQAAAAVEPQDKRSNPTRVKYDVPPADALKEFLSAKPVGTIVSLKEMRTFIVERNYLKTALGYALQKALDAGLLKPTTERGLYERIGE